MPTTAHLWAIAYDNMERADQVRDEITRLGWDRGHVGSYLILLDIAVVVRHSDGSFTFDRDPFPGAVCPGWIVMAGVVAVLMGICVLTEWPVAGQWFIGLCIAVDFICHGVSWSALALVERKPLQE